jgi:hypothetical protein
LRAGFSGVGREHVAGETIVLSFQSHLVLGEDSEKLGVVGQGVQAQAASICDVMQQCVAAKSSGCGFAEVT